MNNPNYELKSKKATEYINDIYPEENGYKYNMQHAVFLSEQEMIEKAVEAFCIKCNEALNHCPDGFPSVCEKREDFINHLNS